MRRSGGAKYRERERPQDLTGLPAGWRLALALRRRPAVRDRPWSGRGMVEERW